MKGMRAGKFFNKYIKETTSTSVLIQLTKYLISKILPPPPQLQMTRSD